MVDSQRLQFWKAFLVEQSGFPAPERLARQLTVASVTEFCDCGCNSFGTYVPPNAGAPPLCAPMDHAAGIFQSYFLLQPSGKSLELVIHADKLGNLSYVNIDCNANSEPVPDQIQVAGPPYHVYASQGLAP
jgi:hypothetical protein